MVYLLLKINYILAVKTDYLMLFFTFCQVNRKVSLSWKHSGILVEKDSSRAIQIGII